MKNNIILILVTEYLICMFALAGEPAKISAKEFQEQYRLGHMQTMNDAEYLGQKDGRAYLLLKRMLRSDSKKWSEQTVYVDLAALDKEFRNQLPAKEYKKP